MTEVIDHLFFWLSGTQLHVHSPHFQAQQEAFVSDKALINTRYTTCPASNELENSWQLVNVVEDFAAKEPDIFLKG